MPTYNYIILACLLLVGCYDETGLTRVGAEHAGGNTYIALRLDTSRGASTRATYDNPTGGELGDGREEGQTNENGVSTAALFLYQDSLGVNGNASTPITMVYFASVDEPQQVELEEGFYQALAIANPRDLSWAQAGGLTLGTVRDHIETEAWTENVADGNVSYSSFLMTSENDGTGVTLNYNPKDDPAIASVDVERMAARVDYMTDGTYTIQEEDDETFAGATVEITGATIVNNLTAGSYLIKRVMDPETMTTTYLGLEEDSDGLPTNYVTDPWTGEKNGQDMSFLYGTYYPGRAIEGDEQNPSFWTSLMSEGIQISDEQNQTWNIVGYTLENTTYQEYTSKDYATGLVFGAKFTPVEGSVVNRFYEGYTFTYGATTFFRWNNHLYATAEDMMATAEPESFTFDKFGEATFESIDDIEGLREFISSLSEADPTGYRAYLQSIGIFPSDKSSLYWEEYMANACHYYFDNESDALMLGEDSRALIYEASGGMVQTYVDSQCYYTWWLRHGNDDSNETNGLMEYAIVRNNIYKVEVASVYTLGGDIPQEGLRARVYVRKWDMYEDETLDM